MTYHSPCLARLRPYSAGEQPPPGSYIKLNTNENPWPPSPLVIERLKAAAEGGLRRYPDPDSKALLETLAGYYGIGVENVFVGNGSDEVLAHAFKAFFRHEAPLCLPDVGYGFYPTFCAYFNITPRVVPVDEQLRIELGDYPAVNGGIVFANPNSPTGHHLGNDEIERLLRRNTDSVVVVDEAYADYAPESALDLWRRHDNLLIVRTLSKSRSLAGLRVGFAIGERGLIEALRRVKNSFNAYPLDSLAAAGAIAAFEDEAYFRKCRAQVIEIREWSAARLRQIGFEVRPSRANFLLARHPSLDGRDCYRRLLERGILARYFPQPRVREYVRISIGTAEEMRELVEASADL